MIQKTVNGFVLCVLVLIAIEVYADEKTVAGVPSNETSTEQHLEAKLLQLDSELRLLEEDLLYPASSRVAVYLSMDLGDMFQLDAVKLQLNGKDVAHHLYTAREVEALYRGGVQQLYVGNARQGGNQITAFFIGKGPSEREYKRATSVDFEQSFEPVFVELTVSDDAGRLQPEFAATVF